MRLQAWVILSDDGVLLIYMCFGDVILRRGGARPAGRRTVFIYMFFGDVILRCLFLRRPGILLRAGERCLSWRVVLRSLQPPDVPRIIAPRIIMRAVSI